MQKIDCKKIVSSIEDEIKVNSKMFDSPLVLAIIDATNDQASKKYISLKISKALELGIKTQLTQISGTSTIEEVLAKIELLNRDKSVNGIMVQLPLYPDLSPYKHRILNSVNPIKDVDGLSAINFGLYSQDVMNGILPATVDACLEIIKTEFTGNLEESNILIINNSDLIGKPLANVLSTLNATVTVANKYTLNLKDLISNADIVVSATGQGELFSGNDVKEGSIIIDVTSIVKDGKVIGDFIPDSNSQKEFKYTPVPGGIGPLTVACLFRNLINLARLQK